ncbi:MAG: hypothetical protein PHU23_18455 [Dehalococcoidales bacterium]|nr:hypothetical protein [Dehalococcoidales bacterium]
MSFLQNNSLVKSLKFARRCNQLNIEAEVVICLAVFELSIPVIGLKIPINGLHFYVEALNRQYEASDCAQIDKQRVPEVLIQLGKFKVLGAKSGCVK